MYIYSKAKDDSDKGSKVMANRTYKLAIAVTGALCLGAFSQSFAQAHHHAGGAAAATSNISGSFVPPVENEPPAAAAPGVSLGAPAGFGASWGQAFIGGGYVSNSQTSSRSDGSIVAGIGLGNAEKYAALEVDAAIISVNPTDGGFGADGNFALKLHHTFAQSLMGVAVGAENIVSWGSAKTQQVAVYGAISKGFLLRPNNPSNPMPIFLTAGVGSGRFMTISQQDAKRDTVGPFGAISWWVLPRVSVILDLAQDQNNAGVSFVPLKHIPISMTLGAGNITRKRTSRMSFIATAGYIFTF